jgi:hypothetical protein
MLRVALVIGQWARASRASQMGHAQIAQNAQPKGQSWRRSAIGVLLHCSMEGVPPGADGGVTVTGTGRKQFFSKNFFEIFFEKIAKSARIN